MTLNKNVEAEVLKAYHRYWDSYLAGDMQTFASMLDENCYVIGTTAFDVFDSKQAAVAFYTETAEQISGKAELRNRKITLLPAGDNVMVHELCDFYFLGEEQWNFYGHARLSSLFSKKDAGWKVIHQHGSFPDTNSSKGEQVGTEKITEENRQLREAVRRRTVELGHQNRELQIEAALERVRARTMAMQHSDELQEAAITLFQQVQDLGTPAWSCGYNIWSDDKKSATAWMSGRGRIQPAFETNSAEDVYLHFLQAQQRGEDLYVEEMTGEQLVKHYQYLSTLPVVGDMIRRLLAEGIAMPTHQIIHVAFFSHGYLMFITYEPAKELWDIFTRFAKVFEQTYTRFLDLKKAEAQANEAKIETALERVRSKTMSMQHSSELAETSFLLAKQVRSLGIKAWGCAFNIFDEGQQSSTEWFSSEEGYLPTYKTPRERFFLKYYEAAQRGESLHVEQFEGEDCAAHYEYLCTLPGVGDALKNMRELGIPFPSNQVDHVAFFKQGYLLFITYEPVPDAHDIFKRFAKTFEQTYTRFLDLQKAEAQTKEAKIESALERVRSRTMAMQRSDELMETSSVLYQQLKELNATPSGITIAVINEDESAFDLWITGMEGIAIDQKFKVSTQEPLMYKKLYTSWKQKQTSSQVELAGSDLILFRKYLEQFNFPVSDSADVDKLFNTCAFFSKGYISIITPDAVSPETIHLLERFAAVFNLTYTRFNDLQIAERHARQAKLDLEKLQTEKKRAEDALRELRSAQTQLIQAEKMASLGELTAGIAHEIQNPLNFVNNFSEVSNELIDEMMEEVGNGNYEEVALIVTSLKQNLEKINHHGKRADGIVKGMLQHSRSGSGQKEPVDINALVDEYLRLAYHGLRAKDNGFNATLQTSFDSSIGMIQLIQQDIGRVVLNLINNAFYAVNERKKTAVAGYEATVTVTTLKRGDQLLISIEDNGNGMPEAVVHKIFQPFFTTKPTGQGTGLGLSLSYDIVKSHGGEIQVMTKETDGAIFTIILPV